MSEIDWPKWVRAWPCIDKNCGGKGTVLLGAHDHGDGDIEYDIHQCQFCTERGLLADEIERLTAEGRRKDTRIMQLEGALGAGIHAMEHHGLSLTGNYKLMRDALDRDSGTEES